MASRQDEGLRRRLVLELGGANPALDDVQADFGQRAAHGIGSMPVGRGGAVRSRIPPTGLEGDEVRRVRHGTERATGAVVPAGSVGLQ